MKLLPSAIFKLLSGAAVSGTLVAAVLLRHPPLPAPSPAPLPVEADRCGGERFDLLRVPGGHAPYIALRLDGRAKSFLLDYGATVSSLTADAFQSGAAAGGKVTLQNFSLPSFPTGRFDLRRYWTARQPPGGQFGVIGTDFLSLLTADFSFRDGSGGDVMISDKPCDADGLIARGLIAVRQAGAFSGDTRRLAPGTPNVPVLYLRVGGMTVPAQIDTGYDDTEYTPSIDINEALYRQLLATGNALKRRGESATSTCEGTATREVYEAPGTAITLNADDGRIIRALENVKLIRKTANGCGGIANMQAPAAQLGASIVSALGTIVVDPKSETVWVAPQP